MTPGADRAAAGHRHPGAGADACREVLRAALEVVQQRGYHGTTVSRVAETAGLGPAVVTRCFPDRDSLLSAALEVAFEQWYDEVPTWQDTAPRGDLHRELGDRLRRGVVGGRRAAHFWRLGLLLRLEPALAGSGCGDLFLEVRDRTRSALRDYWQGILPGDVARDPDLVDLAVRGHMALVDGSMLATHGTPEWDLEQMLAFVARGVAAALEAREVTAAAPGARGSGAR